ncbi:hypothetical protein [Mycobacterium sp.]|uniref:hypothetical protein n=1 Tax=Mycobacterium sp. TaxID=1785 RepID=UPI003342D104
MAVTGTATSGAGVCDGVADAVPDSRSPVLLGHHTIAEATAANTTTPTVAAAHRAPRRLGGGGVAGGQVDHSGYGDRAGHSVSAGG